jgi:hypothetical protein
VPPTTSDVVAQETTGTLAWNASAADVQSALAGLAHIGVGNVVVTRNDDVYVIRFQGSLSGLALKPLLPASSLTKVIESAGGIVGPAPASATVTTRGGTGYPTPATNQVQVLSISATGGTYYLTFHVGTTLFTTGAIPYNASAEQVRQTIQDAIAVGATNDLNLRAYLVAKLDVMVDRYPSANGAGDVYVLSFQGELRTANFGPGLDTVVVHPSLTGSGASATVTTRVDGIDYYGFETVNIATGSGASGEVFNVQGTSAGSNGFAQDGGTAVTNIALNGGSDRVYIASNADLDEVSAAGFQFLTGNLDDLRGALNVDFGTGTGQRLFMSDEASAHDDIWAITDSLADPWLAAVGSTTGLDSSAEIFVTRAGRTGISYKAAASADLFGGVIYWTGFGNDHVSIDGTHSRNGARTTTLLNTGLGDDTVDVALNLSDGFFVLTRRVARPPATPAGTPRAALPTGTPSTPAPRPCRSSSSAASTATSSTAARAATSSSATSAACSTRIRSRAGSSPSTGTAAAVT